MNCMLDDRNSNSGSCPKNRRKNAWSRKTVQRPAGPKKGRYTEWLVQRKAGPEKGWSRERLVHKRVGPKNSLSKNTLIQRKGRSSMVTYVKSDSLVVNMRQETKNGPIL